MTPEMDAERLLERLLQLSSTAIHVSGLQLIKEYGAQCAAREREECAEEADYFDQVVVGANSIASAIRARKGGE